MPHQADWDYSFAMVLAMLVETYSPERRHLYTYVVHTTRSRRNKEPGGEEDLALYYVINSLAC